MLPAVLGIFSGQLAHPIVPVGLSQNRGRGDARIGGVPVDYSLEGNVLEGLEAVSVHEHELRTGR